MWSQVSSVLPPCSCLGFVARSIRVGFKFIPSARRFDRLLPARALTLPDAKRDVGCFHRGCVRTPKVPSSGSILSSARLPNHVLVALLTFLENYMFASSPRPSQLNQGKLESFAILRYW